MPEENALKLRGVERFREMKREWGVPEGLIERMLPLPEEPVRITSIRDIMDLKAFGGVSRGPAKGIWYRVVFPSPVRDAAVVAVAEGKGGAIKTRAIDKIESVKVAGIGKISDVRAKTISRITTSKSEISGRLKRDFGDWWAFNWARDSIVSVLTEILYWVHYHLVQPQTDKVQLAINSAIGDINSKINRQVDTIASRVNTVVGDFNSKIDRQIDRVTDRTNYILSDLYDMWGLPKNMALAPVHIRNVRSAGFEWLSLGNMKCHWICIGKR